MHVNIKTLIQHQNISGDIKSSKCTPKRDGMIKTLKQGMLTLRH